VSNVLEARAVPLSASTRKVEKIIGSLLKGIYPLFSAFSLLSEPVPRIAECFDKLLFL
jgi:hypothetical protein